MSATDAARIVVAKVGRSAAGVHAEDLVAHSHKYVANAKENEMGRGFVLETLRLLRAAQDHAKAVSAISIDTK